MDGITLCTGFGGADIGMKDAGVNVIYGVEIDDAIASVARNNGLNVDTRDIRSVYPGKFIGINALHVSPPCPGYSMANRSRREDKADIDIANTVASFVNIVRPKIFTLENVMLYRKSESWKIIENALNWFGYMVDATGINMSDLGVPQSRRRFIVRATLNKLPPRLRKPESHVGWYDAVKDLLDGMDEVGIPKWQERLVDMLDYRDKNVLVSGDNTRGADGPPIVLSQDQPCFTIRSSRISVHRAFMADGRILRINMRGIARFQSFPDSYILPDKTKLATVGLGNAIPPLAMKKIYQDLLEQI